MTQTHGPMVDRQLRKQLVFPIMYGWYATATEQEMHAWRAMATDFIYGLRHDVPLTLEDFRAYIRTAGN